MRSKTHQPEERNIKKLPWYWPVIGTFCGLLIASGGFAMSWGYTKAEVLSLKENVQNISSDTNKNTTDIAVNTSETASIKEDIKEIKEKIDKILQIMLDKKENK